MTEEGTRVANGQHIVPAGIAVEPFADNFKAKLTAKTPVEVSELLQSKDLMDEYEKMTTKATSGSNAIFSEIKLVKVIQEFQTKFEEKGVTVVVCMFTSNMGNYRWFWLEFVDHSLFPSGTYKPEYDISEYQVVLESNHVIPPKGVAIEQLSDWSSSQLVKECPPEVKTLLESKLLMGDYDRLVQTLKDTKTARTFTGTWKTTEVAKLLQEFQPIFESNGVEVVVCKKPLDELGWEFVKWLEFIDIEAAPEQYFPKHNVDEDHQSERMSKRGISVGSSFFGGKDVAAEALVTDGVIKVAPDCPDDVAILLEEKGISDADYDLLDSAISQCKSMRNFVDAWRLAEQSIIVFPPIESLRSTFLAKGVKLVLCESLGKSGKMYWIEYIDTEAKPDYNTPYDISMAGDYDAKGLEEGEETKAVQGWLKVPEGVYVEGLNGVKKLSGDCPAKVRDFLTRKGLSPTYDEFIEAIVKSKKTRNWASSWRTAEIQKILEEFQEQFLFKGVRAVLCKIIPDGGQPFRWFEFVDLSVAEGYVSQYDYANDGPAELELPTTTLKFPNGVAVEKLTDHKSLMENIPETVSVMMEKKNCMDLYIALVEILCRGGEKKEDKTVGWSAKHMKEAVTVLTPKFESGGGEYYDRLK
mmetsp:Transcript_20738/g.50964  ORF Transcript_20738/g.50964 Transcript_20738/m.50964 type:complete len:639 (+) Transcript_20738:59-1975(+)